MDKRTLKHLERLFEAEIHGKTCQLHPKTAARLAKDGLITIDARAERIGPFTATFEFHTLTHAGRYFYCSTCTEEDAP